MYGPHHVLTARDVMATSLVTLHPDTPIGEAIGTLLKNSISGAPVVEGGALVGILSEHDCLRVFASGGFYAEMGSEAGAVRNYMTAPRRTVRPEEDLYALAHQFLHERVRRFPVVAGDRLLGQVSRRDVLAGIERMHLQRTPRKHYPDYREPA